MATVTLLRGGKVTQVEVPTALDTEDDCRVWMSYWKARGNGVWDAAVVGPFVDVYNAGTASLETLVTVANGEIIAQSDINWPITENEIKQHIDDHGYTLTR